MTIPCALKVRMRATRRVIARHKPNKSSGTTRIAIVVERRSKATARKMKCILHSGGMAPRMIHPVPCRPNHGMVTTVSICRSATVLSALEKKKIKMLMTIRAAKNSARPAAPASRTPKNDAPATKKTIRHAINLSLIHI